METKTFPRIVRFFETTESSGSTCPHCGANGRVLGAMRGCVRLFPVSPVAIEELRLRTKLVDYKKRGWNGLNRRDAEALEAIEKFYTGALDERRVLEIVKVAKQANTARYRR